MAADCNVLEFTGIKRILKVKTPHHAQFSLDIVETDPSLSERAEYYRSKISDFLDEISGNIRNDELLKDPFGMVLGLISSEGVEVFNVGVVPREILIISNAIRDKGIELRFRR